MPTLTITPVNVAIIDQNSNQPSVQAGETIQQGDAYYLEDGKAFVADNVNRESAEVAGIAVTPANTDEYFLSLNSGRIKPGSTSMTVGTLYYLGVEGDIIEEGDLAPSAYITPLYRAETASIAQIELTATGIQHP